MFAPTLGAPAPAGASALFDGRDLSLWTNMEGGPAAWVVRNGVVEVVPNTGDICTKETFSDHLLHLEFMLSDMPEATGQGKANSGVFVQGRYEIQVLDSSAWRSAGTGACGAVYDQFAPLYNACLPALEWQTYDIAFRAPRCEGEVVRENARLSVLHNGIMIHNNIELRGVTGAPTDLDVHLPGHLRLQDHGNPIWYRNIWVVSLPQAGAQQYGEE